MSIPILATERGARRRPARLLPCVLVAALLAGCGYRFVDERAAFPGADTLRVEAFTNHSVEPGLEHMLADAIGEEFTRRGALRPVYDPGRGDLVLSGQIREVRIRASSFSSVALSVEDAIEVELGIEVRPAAGGEPVWRRESIRFTELFLSSPDPQTNESNKEQALRRLSALIAERIHDELFQRF